jgi:hypothetical protein
LPRPRRGASTPGWTPRGHSSCESARRIMSLDAKGAVQGSRRVLRRMERMERGFASRVGRRANGLGLLGGLPPRPVGCPGEQECCSPGGCRDVRPQETKGRIRRPAPRDTPNVRSRDAGWNSTGVLMAHPSPPKPTKRRTQRFSHMLWAGAIWIRRGAIAACGSSGGRSAHWLNQPLHLTRRTIALRPSPLAPARYRPYPYSARITFPSAIRYGRACGSR